MGCSSCSESNPLEKNENGKKKSKPLEIDDSFLNDLKISHKNQIRRNESNIKKDYQFLEKIGSGGFGVVFKAKHKKTGILRAIKVISLGKEMNNEKEMLNEEINILSKLDHPNIIKIHDFYINDNNFFIVNEIVTGGELYDEIMKLEKFDEKLAADIMKQVLSAIYYLHENHITHRDIKPENILLDKHDGDNINIKLIDFGTATVFTRKKLKELTGTPYYMAPEVLANNYDKKCDLWSCGVLLYILLSGIPPFNGTNQEQILESVKKGAFTFPDSYFKNVSASSKDLIKQLLSFDPRNRISAKEALKHPWFQNASTHSVDEQKLLSVFDNLKKFNSTQKLQQASLAYIVHHMSSKKTSNELREIFRNLDTSGDGRLTIQEIIDGYQKYFKGSYSDSDFEKIVSSLDSDGNGFIEYEEFLKATISVDELTTEKNLELAFNYFDEDKSGKLDKIEIKKALGIAKNSDKDIEIAKLINGIDQNGDGLIDFEEFKQLMKTLS